jgi:hypothetical protein
MRVQLVPDEDPTQVLPEDLPAEAEEDLRVVEEVVVDLPVVEEVVAEDLTKVEDRVPWETTTILVPEEMC